MAGKFSPIENLLITARDKFLVKESIAGNPTAFSTLMFLYKKRVEAVGRRFFKNQNDLDDFIQEVFIKVYKNLDTYKGESKFSTWLTRIAFNTGINFVSRTKETESLIYEDSEVLNSPYETPEENGMRNFTKAAIQSAITQLPEKYARCVEMHFFLDMTYEDISETTGIPVNTIKTHIFTAKKMLYEKLKEFKYE